MTVDFKDESICKEQPKASSSWVVWDIDPIDFHLKGNFAQLQKSLNEYSFDALVRDEASRVCHFLFEWEKQLIEYDSTRFKSCSKSLHELFLETPNLSGVIYLSCNQVISEAFFNAEQEGLDHVTDRRIHSKIQKHLPSTKDLTFSFPRKYSFFGYDNSWGFIRFPRIEDLERLWTMKQEPIL